VELAKLRGKKKRNYREEEDEEKRKRKKTGRSSEIRSDFSHGLVIRINYVPPFLQFSTLLPGRCHVWCHVQSPTKFSAVPFTRISRPYSPCLPTTSTPASTTPYVLSMQTPCIPLQSSLHHTNGQFQTNPREEPGNKAGVSPEDKINASP
jgi:hypothetical protein